MDGEQRLGGRLSILDSGATEEEKKKKRRRSIRCEPKARENRIPKCAPWIPSDPRPVTRRSVDIFLKLNIWVLLEKLSKKSKFHQNLTRITGTLQ
jgi:hypothetical protein